MVASHPPSHDGCTPVPLARQTPWQLLPDAKGTHAFTVTPTIRRDNRLRFATTRLTYRFRVFLALSSRRGSKGGIKP